MLKKFLLLLAIMPLLNFLHESGHWLGGKFVGAEPKILLQKVDMGDESQFSQIQMSVYNWGGPAVNFAFIGASFVYPAILPIGLSMACHRLGPNLFATYLHLNGRQNFTTDETKQFSKENRLWVAITFSAFYLAIALVLISMWLTVSIRLLAWSAIPAMSIAWFGYLIFLDYFDKKF
jgi:hypothetical protein